MTNKVAVCKNEIMAIEILTTVMKTLNSDTQRAALKAVSAWIQENMVIEEVNKMSPAEREIRIREIFA